MVPKITLNPKPINVDAKIQKLQAAFVGLTWLQYAFGRSWRLTRLEQDGKKQYVYPAAYARGTDYADLLPNDNFKSYCFFSHRDEAKPVRQIPGDDVYLPGQLNQWVHKVDLIFWFNFQKMDAAAAYPQTENYIQEVRNLLRKFSFFSITGIFYDADKIFESYSIQAVNQQYLMWPYGGFRIAGEINFLESTAWDACIPTAPPDPMALYITALRNAGATITTAQENLIYRFYYDLTGIPNVSYPTYNLLNRFTAIYPIIGGTAGAHAANLISPALHPLVWLNDPVHSAVGVYFNGLTQDADTGIEISGMNMNRMGAYIYNYYETGVNAPLFGIRNEDGSVQVNMFTSSFKIGAVGMVSVFSFADTAPAAKLLGIDINQSVGRVVRNGAVVFATAGVPTTASLTGTIRLARTRSNGTSFKEMTTSFFAICNDNLSDAEQSAFAKAVDALQNGLSRGWDRFMPMSLSYINAIRALGISLTSVQMEAINRFVQDINGVANTAYTTYSIVGRFTAMWPMIGGTAAAHALNLINPATFAMSWVGSPTHAATGVAMNGTTQLGITGVAYPVPFVELGVDLYNYSEVTSATQGYYYGSNQGGSQVLNVVVTSGKISSAAINGAFFSGTIINTFTPARLMIAEGKISTGGAVVINGVTKGTVTAASMSTQYPTTPNIPLNGRRPTTADLTKQMTTSYFAIRSGVLSAAEHTFYAAAVHALQTALGRQNP